jgi:hypothetical protein
MMMVNEKRFWGHSQHLLFLIFPINRLLPPGKRGVSNRFTCSVFSVKGSASVNYAVGHEFHPEIRRIERSGASPALPSCPSISGPWARR